MNYIHDFNTTVNNVEMALTVNNVVFMFLLPTLRLPYTAIKVYIVINTVALMIYQ